MDYLIEMAEDAFGENSVLADIVKKVTAVDSPRVMLVADMNVVQRTEGLGSKIGRYLQAHGLQLAGTPVVLSGGEKIKTDALQGALRVATAILDAKIGNPDGCVLALGGGSVLDVASYSAAQVRGGVRTVRIPTTLAAMADGAFAEYGAVDLPDVKDAMRIASKPSAVIVDPLFARTVFDGVWQGGASEIVRIAAVCGASLLKKAMALAEPYRARDYEALRTLVGDVVALRKKKKVPPFAEWAANRLEALSDFKLPHGYAVSIAILIDASYAVAKGLLGEEQFALLRSALEALGALDGMVHSRHLLKNADVVLRGLDAWMLTIGNDGIAYPSGLGKSVVEKAVDREVYREVLATLAQERD